MKREIRKYGDPVLREKSRPIPAVNDEIRKLAEDMIDTMRAAEGCGLAAQQVGETRAICVVCVPPDLDKDAEGRPQHPHLHTPVIMVNPQISEASKKMEGREEGCLSFPDIRGSIQRAVEITLKFTGLDGKPRVEQLRDFAARVVQHEVDHLHGILFIDKMSPAKKFALKRKIATLKHETEEKLGTAR
jgi:peptide deformylase